MNASLIISTAAAAISLVALSISALLGVRQLRLSRQSVHVPTFLALMAEFRKPEFHDRYNYVVMQLKDEHDPELGVYGLPDAARTAVIDVAYFFQNSVCFAAMDLLDESKIIAFIQMRLLAVWEALKPYINTERKRNPAVGKHWLSTLETYAERAKDLSEEQALTGYTALNVIRKRST